MIKKKFLFLILFFCNSLFAKDIDLELTAKNFKKTLSELVHAQMVNPPGNESKGVDILAKRLDKAQVVYQRMEFGKNRSNLVARLKGNGKKKPILLLAHLDVVGVDHQNWTVPQFEMTESQGFLYGRGVLDDLGMAVANLEIFLALKESGRSLSRDIILAFTGDEESGGLGLRTLLEKHPDWIQDAEIGFNEGGGPVAQPERGVQFIALAAAEKTYQDFTLTTKGDPGHSSLPYGDNAIEVLSRAIAKIGQQTPEMRLLPVTKEYFLKRSQIEPKELATAMKAVALSKNKIDKKAVEILKKNHLESLLMTTCVPTIVSGGTRVNALPAEAKANINCRILPDESVAQVKSRLEKWVQDPRVKISMETEFGEGGVSVVQGEVPQAVEKIAKRIWPQSFIIPSLLSGATDSRFLRKTTQMYGLSPLFRYEQDAHRAHGIDERIPVEAIPQGIQFFYDLIIELSS